MSVVKRRDPHAHDSSPRATTHDRYERTIADDLRHTPHTRPRDARCNSSSSSSQYDDSRTLPIDLHPRRVERGDRCSSLRFMGGPPYATRHRHAIAKRHVVVCRPACTCAWSVDRRGHRGVIRDVRAVGRVGARRVADVGAVVVELRGKGRRKGGD